MKLLIVESPGKIKTLRKILGREWRLEASVGHTTELAHDGPKRLGFEIADGRIITRYIPRGARGKSVLSKLRAAVRQADEVYLAMDADREGEAIAWHLVEQLRLKKYIRVMYSEITESAIRAALAKPRRLDMHLVYAQRARQCLDKLVGYEVSPLLWNTSGGKSAGRVQSATLHLVCVREHERLAFKPHDFWTLQAQYKEGLVAQFEARGSRDSLPEERLRISSELEAKRIEKVARTNPHIVEARMDQIEQKAPLAPLITSSLQQVAGVRLKFSPQKTMQVAQELYEGIGGSGLITYMRTDSVSLSAEFVAATRLWLEANSPASVCDRGRAERRVDLKSAKQGAHEAIRPTAVALTPEIVSERLNREQLSLYRLIWERAVASQCRPATLSRTQIEILSGTEADPAPTRWVARGLVVLNPGYLRFWQNIEKELTLPNVKKGQVLGLKDIKVEKKVTQAPARYSEAKLVQLMEKLGIGRPSTYASTVKLLRDRDYVVIEKGALVPTSLGLATDRVLTLALPELVDVRFTAQMETSLDLIAENKVSWEKFLSNWSTTHFEASIVRARRALSGFGRSSGGSQKSV